MCAPAAANLSQLPSGPRPRAIATLGSDATLFQNVQHGVMGSLCLPGNLLAGGRTHTAPDSHATYIVCTQNIPVQESKRNTKIAVHFT